MTTRRTKRMRRFARQLFSSPLRQSAAPAGDLEPRGIRLFEAKTGKSQHQKRSAIRIGAIRQWRTKMAARH